MANASPGAGVEGSPPNGAAPPSDPADPLAALRREFSAFVQKVDGKLTTVGQDLGRIRDRIKDTPKEAEGQTGSPPGDQTGNQPGTIDRSEGIAMMRLGRLQAGLPDEVQKEIDDMLENGSSYVEATNHARAVKRGMELAATAGVAGGPKIPTTLPGKAATAPGATPPEAYPKTEREYLRLVKAAVQGDAQAVKRRDAIHADPNFHPEDLPKK